MSESKKQRKRRIQASGQYGDGKFVNPNGVKSEFFTAESWDIAKAYMFGTRIDPRPKEELKVHKIQNGEWTNLLDFQFAWLGHSSLLISTDGQIILVDPVLEERASPYTWIGPTRFHPTPVKGEALPEIDVVLITHNHYDHLEEPTIIYLREKAHLFLVPLGIGELLEGWGVSPDKIVELDWWETHKTGTLEFHATPAVHYSNRGLFDGNKQLWCSWSVQGAERKFFISGDSGYFDGFKTIGEKLGPFDVTFLKIGAYNDRGTWRAMHMTPEEAFQQHADLKGKLLVPLHWATFDLGLHPWYEPMERLLTVAGEDRARIITPEIGRRIDLFNQPPLSDWWQPYK